MIGLLARLFIRDREQTEDPGVRGAYGVLCGATGIFLNLCLFVGKLFAGRITGSISIMADALNNLSDAGSSVVTLLGFHLAGAKPDSGHPFGHGRIEYLSGLIVSGAILLMGFELVRESVKKIVSPQPVAYSALAFIILLLSICVKLYMFYYNRSVGKKLDSAAMRATATDSLSDCFATGAALVAAAVGTYSGLQIDGFCGAIVGGFIFYAGIRAARETLNPLLGQPPEKEYVKRIEELVMGHSEVRGVHDLIVHDYGPGRRMISLHAEVSAKADILAIHEVIDQIEEELRELLRCDAVIHMDPVVTEDGYVNSLREAVDDAIREADPRLSMHDFRVVPGTGLTKLIFDLEAPYGFHMKDEEAVREIQGLVAGRIGGQYQCIIRVDKAFVGK